MGEITNEPKKNKKYTITCQDYLNFMNYIVPFCHYIRNTENTFMTGVRRSIYGSPADCLWGGGRAGFGSDNPEVEVLKLTQEYGISARLTFSNSLFLGKEHLTDKKCNILCKMFEEVGEKKWCDRPFGFIA